jgi:hypothetical protein
MCQSPNYYHNNVSCLTDCRKSLEKVEKISTPYFDVLTVNESASQPSYFIDKTHNIFLGTLNEYGNFTYSQADKK